MKKMLLILLALLITGCAQQTFTVQNKPAAVAPKETITHHFFVSGIGQKKTVDAAKFVAAQKMLIREPANIHLGLLGFITLSIYTPLEARVCAHNNCMSCPSIGNSICTLINILLGSFQLFLHSDQPLSEGEIIIRLIVCQSGGGCIIPPGGENG